MMVAPEFLFLEEPGREQVSNFSLASRLSYFLWKTTPDRELLSHAAKGDLREESVLKEQVDRLLLAVQGLSEVRCGRHHHVGLAHVDGLFGDGQRTALAQETGANPAGVEPFRWHPLVDDRVG